jgi:hypothetical protein
MSGFTKEDPIQEILQGARFLILTRQQSLNPRLRDHRQIGLSFGRVAMRFEVVVWVGRGTIPFFRAES